ncbi:MAG: hypothetical protein HGA45_44265 [Chloroflexales bacterium]|nr:hypothetical protein [Chloroflexales bacterium]
MKPATSRNNATPAPVAAPPASKAAPTISEVDPALDQLLRLWSSLHPHARRAVVLYAGDLLVETTIRRVQVI